MRTRRNEWIAAGVFAGLEQIVLETYDRVVGLDLADITVDGQITKAPCGGEVAGNALLALMTAIIVIRRLTREAWTNQRWDTRPARRP